MHSDGLELPRSVCTEVLVQYRGKSMNAKLRSDGGRDDRDGVVALEREIDKGRHGPDWLVPACVTLRCAS